MSINQKFVSETNSKSLAIKQQTKTSWTIEDSEQLYGIEGWGEPYFSINAAGNITVSPQGASRGISLDLYELVESLKKRNIGLPLLIRFSDILADRMERLCACMNRAIARYNYNGKYQGVFPVKCNQNRHLLEDLVRYGQPYQFGLEAGSKPELMIALAILEPNTDSSETLLICNGYKDREYIETALLATRLGHKPIIVIEQITELYTILQVSQELDIKPIIGVRAKLNSKGMGRWGNSTGDRAKFGLTIPQILQVVTELETSQMLESLQLLHFHIGSQISSIAVIKDAIREASQIYVQLAQMGAKMGYLDVGGGLAVDYDGSKSNFQASKNYNMQNYANDIVAQIKDACGRSKIAVPTLISESGRAIASHQSVLIFDVLGTNQVSLTTPQPSETEEHLVLSNFWETYQSIKAGNIQETYNDAIQFKEEAQSLFNLGYLTLIERSRAEELYWACLHKIAQITRNQADIPDELQDLAKIMASIYYINLSVFQSAPDSWAIDQLFPIMPIHRLHEQPTARAILADLTCDSDGKIDRFINRKDSKDILELHPLTNQPYYLGMFLVGAYQEIMGNLHNLFGDTNVVHIQMTPKSYQIKYVVKGDTIKDVLGYVQYKAGDLLEIMRCRTETALEENRITLEEAQKLLQNYESSLDSYTYLVGN
ncbi:MAG: biosynthetic arginine decarboxylase [Xenococcaceae cyanobacterium MO_188.B19]|nr:biosynthetic arginine decarboxylase [Xenococcaceae cyanobacterium MO_188.B19]